MFDLYISLFILNIRVSIVSYFDCSYVSIEFQCSHTYMSWLSLLVLRTKGGVRTEQWWMYRLQSGNTEGIKGLGYEEVYDIHQ